MTTLEFESIDDQTKFWIGQIYGELLKAKDKHPRWPSNDLVQWSGNSL